MNDRYDRTTRAATSTSSRLRRVRQPVYQQVPPQQAPTGLRPVPSGSGTSPQQHQGTATTPTRPARPGARQPAQQQPVPRTTPVSRPRPRPRPATSRHVRRRTGRRRRTTPGRRRTRGSHGYETASGRADGSAPERHRQPRCTSTGQQPRVDRADRLHPAAGRPAAAARSRAAGPTGTTSTEQFAFVEEHDERVRGRHRLAQVHRDPHRAPRGGQAPRPQPDRRPGRGARLVAGRRRRLPLVRRQAARPGLVRRQRGRDDGRGRAEARRDRRPPAQHGRAAAHSTALLVDNTTTRQGTTVLLPNTLAADHRRRLHDHPRQVGRRRRLGRHPGRRSTPLLGANIQGTWRLDTPYLEYLVDAVGNIDVDTNADGARPRQGEGQAPRRQGQGPDAQRPGGRRLRHLPRPRRVAGRAAGALRPGHAGRAAQDVRATPQARPRPCRRWRRSSTRR